MAADNILVLKMTEKGFPKEHMAVMVVALFPFELLFPVLVGGWASRGNPLRPWLVGYPARMLLTLLGCGLLLGFPSSLPIPASYYALTLLLQLGYSLLVNVMFVSQCALFSQVSDPRIGGTYMTLLNTLANLGNTWPKLAVFWLVDQWSCGLSVSEAEQQQPLQQSLWCSRIAGAATDGFYPVSLLCFLLGCLWYAAMRDRVAALGTLDRKAWLTQL